MLVYFYSNSRLCS